MDRYAELKRKLRKLKKLESRFRTNTRWVWDSFFSMKENDTTVKYPLEQLITMDHDNYRRAIDEYLCHLYTMMPDTPVFDPEILAQLGLPPDADKETVRKRFRLLAKKYHPDAGGDEGLFIQLKERYNKLINK